jgi:hypothetical protein
MIKIADNGRRDTRPEVRGLKTGARGADGENERAQAIRPAPHL